MNKSYYFKEVDSTNEFAKSLLKEVQEWTVVIADVQKRGKGRLGKTWYSPPEGLWFSVILKPNSLCQLIPLVAGVAVCEAVKELGVDARIKWPNDILINGKKVAGILAEFEEVQLSGDAFAANPYLASQGIQPIVVLGVGINLNISEFPEEIKNIATSLLLEKGKPFDKEKVFKLVLKKIEEKYNVLGNGKVTSPLLDEWRAYSITLGKKVRVWTPNGMIQGKAIDIAEDGALLLKLPDGKIEKILAGECSVQLED